MSKPNSLSVLPATGWNATPKRFHALMVPETAYCSNVAAIHSAGRLSFYHRATYHRTDNLTIMQQ
ncbi:hypothetical protein [Neisseria weixii]|uniref:hypothetical protein n=1 Tax=Neisseria weixii TaxID=1853276 RepID=UPI0012FDDEC4|nr:hypothetical protein [Neisseria weixii]